MMFTNVGIRALHGATHESLDVLLGHVATVPNDLLRKELAGFGFPTVWKQLVHILTVEEGWVNDLQHKEFPGWFEEHAPTIDTLLGHKDRILNGTRAYIDSLSEEQLNTTLAKKPKGWFGELRSPAFILLH